MNNWFYLVITIAKALSLDYHYVVVGGGTAGCVVASRLSEDPDVNVLLLEAGPSDRDYQVITVPALWNKLGELDWHFKSEPLKKAGQIVPDKRGILYQARVLGGSSSHNGMAFLRGNPADYNTWRDLGNPNWGYKDVLPYFKKLEDMQVPELLTNGFHGQGGPVTITQEETGKLLRTFLDAGMELGFNVTDSNSDKQIGLGINQVNRNKGRRASTSEAYIWPIIGRRNLRLMLNAFVFKIRIAKGKATGVHYQCDGTNYFVSAKREVVVSAGALNSPKLLMHSGIGPKRHLKKLKIPMVKDLPVGKRLIDHMYTYMNYHVNEPISILEKDCQSFENLLRFMKKGDGPFARSFALGHAFTKASSQRKKDMFPFLQIHFGNGTYPPSKDHYGFFIGIYHLHLRTLGKVQLTDKNIFSPPKVTMTLLENPQDLEDLLEGIRLVQTIANTTAFQLVGATLVPESLEACSHLTYDTDEYWRCYITYWSFPGTHFLGTCRMGIGKSGVVDSKLRVRGIKSLRVVDGSIIPTSLSGNTMAPIIMVGEKASDIIKQRWHKKLS